MAEITTAQIEGLRDKLMIIEGNAVLIADDDRTDPITASKARIIRRTSREIVDLMGWTARPKGIPNDR